MTFVILGCALPQYNVWWPFFVVFFYALSPIPTRIAKHSEQYTDLAIFFTMGFVVSSFGLPIVLARSPIGDPVIQWGACYLILAGNVIVYLTEFGFLMTVEHDDEYGGY